MTISYLVVYAVPNLNEKGALLLILDRLHDLGQF